MLIALTGGIATGKTTFRRLLVDRHPFEFFDADACVHELLSSDAGIIAAVTAAFGHGVLSSEGQVNRQALRPLVFADPDARRRLEAILHPAVRQRWQGRLDTCRESGRDFLADIPLLFETSGEGYFEASVLVAASGGVQRERLGARGLDSGMVEQMLASQWPMVEKLKRASSVVWNDGTLGALARQADLLLECLPLRQPRHR
jgi:dephospho-CoA kinase